MTKLGAAVIAIDWGSATAAGPARPHNEDSLLAAPQVFVVADGMGGHAAGEVASGLVVAEFQRLSQAGSISAMDVLATLHRANAVVVTAGSTAERVGMGTTVVGLALVEEAGSQYWMAFNVGDSRLYRSFAGKIEQLSVDHSAVQELMDAQVLSPADRAGHPQRHILTRAIGSEPAPTPNYCLMIPVPGEQFLLCSDGVSGDLAEEQLQHLLSLEEHAEVVARRLVDAARAAGSTDDSTALVVNVRGDASGEVDESTVPRASGPVDGATS